MDFKQSKPSKFELIPKTNNSEELQEKKVCGHLNCLGTPSMNVTWAYVRIAEQGASWVLIKTQREEVITNSFC